MLVNLANTKLFSHPKFWERRTSKLELGFLYHYCLKVLIYFKQGYKHLVQMASSPPLRGNLLLLLCIGFHQPGVWRSPWGSCQMRIQAFRHTWIFSLLSKAIFKTWADTITSQHWAELQAGLGVLSTCWPDRHCLLFAALHAHYQNQGFLPCLLEPIKLFICKSCTTKLRKPRRLQYETTMFDIGLSNSNERITVKRNSFCRCIPKMNQLQ